MSKRGGTLVKLSKEEKEMMLVLKNRKCVDCSHCEDKNGKKVYPCVMYDPIIDRRG